ncbi:hypothetical protein AUC68_11700 [Methyloceanibacter methanicus]|uniref:Phospholipid/glycerol acyltransferase domain-containing protein n=1 Tax=Methyloceanibacter methanicus TaxID=1774968 RepID=A0A1E3W5F4_9HYPH|nr:1-acyl-sn-glycerol-3-phosphate acyltransferase [Methyloceanibacter methanicus]ODS01048.1 hypothetical protein AUC68_11700 [Methyloceanibacter methanicus]
MKNARAFLVLATFFAFTLPLMPLQHLFVRTGSRFARTFPHWYHRQVCRIVGVRLSVDGALERQNGVLVVSNHVSWLDITVLSAVAPVSFVAKQEVSTWPFVKWLAKLQRSVFVDRERRTQTSTKANEILDRRRGRATTWSSLPKARPATATGCCPSAPHCSRQAAGRGVRKRQRGKFDIAVQTLALTYTKVYGLPLGRRGRPQVAWYGDMDLASHAWRLLGLGPLEANIRIGPPVPLDDFPDRKALARYTEDKIRNDVVELLRGRPAE